MARFDWTSRRGGRERAPEPPEKPSEGGLKGLLSRLATAVPRRVYALTVALTLGTVGVIYELTGDKEKSTQGAVDLEHDPVLKQTHEGDWDFEVYRTAEVLVDATHGNTLYAFIKGTLQDKALLDHVADQDKAYYIDAFIALIKDLNPGVDINDFQNINGKTLIFPDYIFVKAHFEKPLSKDDGGYSRLQDLAEADGYPVKSVAKQEATFEASLKEAVDIPDSPNYRHKDDGTNNSVLKLRADVIPRLEETAVRVKATQTSRGAGFTMVYTDAMRSPAVNADAAHRKQGSSKGTTHTTPGSLDGASGRFVTPDGVEITVSIDDPGGAKDTQGKPLKVRGPDADFIEQELAPALQQAALDAGFTVFYEGTHLHLYAPKYHTLDLDFRDRTKDKKAPTPTQGPSVTRTEAQTAYEEGLDKVLLDVADRSEESDAAKQLREIDKFVGRVVNHNSDRFHTVLCTDTADISADDFCLYDSPSEELMAKYSGQTLDQLQLQAEKMIAASALAQGKTAMTNLGRKMKPGTKAGIQSKLDALEKTVGNSGSSWEDLAAATEALDAALQEVKVNIQKPNSDEFKTLARVRNSLLRSNLIDVIRAMNDDQVVNNDIFDGSVVSRYADIEAAWRYKKDHKGGAVVNKYYPYLHMEGKNHTLSMRKWYERQEAAAAYLKAHGAELGYPQELIDYMSPALMLSVVHAEMFSEFSGETFVDLAPVLFSAHNLVYGPALNDHELSGGFVQMIYPTFKGLLHEHGDQLTALREEDPSYLIIVPQIQTYTDTVKITTGKGKKRKTVNKEQTVREYDREKFPEAMLTDIDSQLFYDQLAILSHITLGMKTLLADAKFAQAWKEASEKDRYLLLGSFSAMAINAGPGSEKFDNGAYKIAKLMLEAVSTTALSDYREAIVPACKKLYGKGEKALTTSRNAERGFETMNVLVSRVEVEEPGLLAKLENIVTPESVPSPIPVPTPVPLAPAPTPSVPTPAPSPAPTRVAIMVTGDPARTPLYKDYSALKDQAVTDGYNLSDDSDANQEIYEATLKTVVPIPDSTDYFRKADQGSDAKMVPEAVALFQGLMRRFKVESGGYSASYAEVLESPEYRATISGNSDSTTYTGRWLSVPDGRFKDPSGKEITWSVPDPHHKGHAMKGPDAEMVEQLRGILKRILEEMQAEGYVVALDAGATGGGYQLYFPKQGKPVYSPEEAAAKLGVQDLK